MRRAEALLNRLKRGVIYAPEKAQRAMENFFKESTLVSLRELALRQTAHELDIRGTTEIAEERKEIRCFTCVTKKKSGIGF